MIFLVVSTAAAFSTFKNNPVLSQSKEGVKLWMKSQWTKLLAGFCTYYYYYECVNTICTSQFHIYNQHHICHNTNIPFLKDENRQSLKIKYINDTYLE